MKKYSVALLLLLLLISQLSFSQIKPFRFGLKIAPNVGWISPDSDGYEKDGSLAGFSWGFISDFTITENYFVGTGFNISYINSKMTYPHKMTIISSGDTTDYTGTQSSKMNLRYIDLPITLKMKTNKFDAIQVYGQIGFSLGFNVKAKAEENFSYKIESTFMNETNERDISEEITLVKGSLILGGGIEYYIDNSTSIVAGITYSNGFTNILQGTNTVDPNIKEKGTPSFIELTLGVIF